MRTFLVCAGMLLSGVGALAQGQKKPAPSTPDTAGKVAVPVRPALPGEEKLTAQERVERDFLMPVRRKLQPAASKPEPAAAVPADATAQHIAAAPAPAGEAAEKPAETSATPATPAAPRRHYTRTKHRSAASRKVSSKKRVTKKTSSRRR